MSRYTIPVGENGRIILPLELRRALGVDKGSRVVIEAQGERLELTTADRLRREAQARYQRLFPDREGGVVEAFLTEKREEARYEGDCEPATEPVAGDETSGTIGAARSLDTPE